MSKRRNEEDAGVVIGRRGWRAPGVAAEGAVTAAVLVAGLLAQGRFVLLNEGRSGVVLPDPVLAHFAPVELSNLTFTLIYGALALGIATLAREPDRLFHALRAYALLAVTRVAMMALVPLDPPATIIPLRDPLVELIGSGAPLTRDLFFSGHTGTLFLLFQALPGGRIRAAMFVLALSVGTLTVAQHTHYVIDVLVAPFVAYGCFRLVERWRPGATGRPGKAGPRQGWRP
jgi:hypothetical protein